MSEYPQSNRLAEVREEWDSIYDFLNNVPYSLAEHGSYHPNYISKTTETVLYEYFGIDPVELEKERKAMLQNMRGMM